MRSTTFRPLRTAIAAALALTSLGAVGAHADDQIHILGWLEHATITSVDIRVDAKLDTGAKTSAIHAEILSRDELSEEEQLELHTETDEDEEMLDFDPDDANVEGQSSRTVVFRVSNEEGEERILEREVVRTVAIKRRSGGVERRPVVELELCIAGILVEGEVSLADRTRFNYPLLVGRDMLDDGDIAVNPDSDYTAAARC
ncbi:MAG: RimK/LysX family protein [Pseudomonadota bacterium]